MGPPQACRPSLDLVDQTILHKMHLSWQATWVTTAKNSKAFLCIVTGTRFTRVASGEVHQVLWASQSGGYHCLFTPNWRSGLVAAETNGTLSSHMFRKTSILPSPLGPMFPEHSELTSWHSPEAQRETGIFFLTSPSTRNTQ